MPFASPAASPKRGCIDAAGMRLQAHKKKSQHVAPSSCYDFYPDAGLSVSHPPGVGSTKVIDVVKPESACFLFPDPRPTEIIGNLCQPRAENTGQAILDCAQFCLELARSNVCVKLLWRSAASTESSFFRAAGGFGPRPELAESQFDLQQGITPRTCNRWN